MDVTNTSMIIPLLSRPDRDLGDDFGVVRFARIAGSDVGRADVSCSAALDKFSDISFYTLYDCVVVAYPRGICPVALVTDWSFADDLAVYVSSQMLTVSALIP